MALVRTDDGHMLAVGHAGERDLTSGRTDGSDPLGAFGPGAAEVLASAAGLTLAGDLMLFGAFDVASGQVVGFEELIGSHGGLGGWQTDPFLMCPATWRPAADPLEGAPAVYQQLRTWRAALEAGATG